MSRASEYTTGDDDIKMKIISEKNVTIDYVVNEANEIWKQVRKRKLKFGDLDAADSLMEEMRKSHPEFCKSYPIVLRYMCQMQEYDHRALRKYMVKIKEHPYTSETEYLDSQTDYIVILYKVRNPRWNATEVNRLKHNVRAMLQREHDVFKTYVEEFDKEVTAETEALNKLNMNELRDFSQAAADTMSLAGTVRVETDLSAGKNIDVNDLARFIPAEPVEHNVNADDLLL